MSNKFLEQYPQLREPRIGDVVCCKQLYGMIPKNGVITQKAYDRYGVQIYYISVDFCTYYRTQEQFEVIEYVEQVS